MKATLEDAKVKKDKEEEQKRRKKRLITDDDLVNEFVEKADLLTSAEWGCKCFHRRSNVRLTQRIAQSPMSCTV